jgi:hypothetical protein
VLRARTNENGVHRVTLVVTDKSGTPLGGSTALTIRSAQISNVIWLFLGLGAVLLFGAIVLRLVRRERWWTRAATIRAADGGMPSDDATDESADRGGDPGSTPENSGSDDATPAPTGARTR